MRVAAGAGAACVYAGLVNAPTAGTGADVSHRYTVALEEILGLVVQKYRAMFIIWYLFCSLM